MLQLLSTCLHCSELIHQLYIATLLPVCYVYAATVFADLWTKPHSLSCLPRLLLTQFWLQPAVQLAQGPLGLAGG
jgi:hypothetical protein